MDRRRRADRYPWFEWKARLFAIGAALGVGGMILESDWVIAGAVLVLFSGFLLRFAPGGQGMVEDEEDLPDE
jgi:hypothetical protein